MCFTLVVVTAIAWTLLLYMEAAMPLLAWQPTAPILSLSWVDTALKQDAAALTHVSWPHTILHPPLSLPNLTASLMSCWNAIVSSAFCCYDKIPDINNFKCWKGSSHLTHSSCLHSTICCIHCSWASEGADHVTGTMQWRGLLNS